MTELYAIVQRHIDNYGPSEAEVARRIGLSPQALNQWKNKGLRKLPSKQALTGLSRVTRTRYEDVLDAALRDAGYLE